MSLTSTFPLYLVLLFLLSRPPPGSTSRPMPKASRRHDDDHRHPWRSFEKFIDAKKGSNVAGMSQLKQYFHHFGYLPPANDSFTDAFDEGFESAVSLYQSKLGLPMTGKLDLTTVSQLMSPRCGVSDTTTTTITVHPSPPSFHAVKHFAFFPGQPEWSRPRPLTLTFAFSPYDSISYIDQQNIRTAFRNSFDRWAAAVPVSFMETTDYTMADIRIGFQAGDHGDGQPFDGVLGVLAHAFSPENGRLHLDKAETWSVDFTKELSTDAVDLESVATHEIGHVLGLGHSSVTDSVMYPSLNPRTKKVNLRMDDVKGVQALYGSNPKFRFSSLIQSEMSPSSSPAGREWRGSFLAIASVMIMLVA